MNRWHTYYSFILLITILGCSREEIIVLEDEVEGNYQIDIPDWSEETHSNDIVPNYNVVFKQNEILRFDIKISSEDWESMQADLDANLGSGNSGPGQGPAQMTDFDPIWVPCSFYFNDIEWYQVGIRFKGNSSLQSTYRMGINKFSFKLDFDQFEDDYPDIKNQRFYGFKQLNLKNNFDDASHMREKVACDLFREFGIASPQASFCVVYVDYGEGPQYFGVYTLIEEVDDTVLESQFYYSSGNLYKPDGDAASFAAGTYNESEMEKKNNEDDADYSDVLALYTVLNSSARISNIEQWKSELESVFDVELFMKWLAANTTMQNWDTYGRMTHNFYLYNNPENNLLTWIPWDNNEALQEGKQGGSLSLSFDEIEDDWPLIRYLIDVPEYQSMYHNYLLEFIEEVFEPSQMQMLYNQYYELLKESAYNEEEGYTFLRNSSDFDTAVEELKAHVQSRTDVVYDFIY